MTDTQEPFAWESAILRRARTTGLELRDDDAERLAAHARAVLDANDRLHLTAIRDPGAFVERHLGEAFEGAAMLDASVSGPMLDLGSGNGYPGIPIAVARAGIVPYLADASEKKAAFLEGALRASKLDRGQVVRRNITRAADLAGLPPFLVVVTRAMGGWERVIPKLVGCLDRECSVLIWGSEESNAVFRRTAWLRFRHLAARRLPGRDRSMIHQLRINS
jgi:16S rRNA G527 N7-methylase RsmG